MSEKIKPQHVSRKAILYVRQSSPYQVMNNLESQKLQCAMEVHLRSLGWSEVEMIDEDLGRSAGGSVTRTGFERMVAQVCLGEVGAVVATPMVARMDDLFAVDAEAQRRVIGLPGRHALRQARVIPLVDDIRRNVEAAQSVALHASALSKACQYALTLWRKLTRFLEYPELELSNNLAENSMRPVALGRKNWIHIGSPQAGPKVAAILSVVESCRRLKLPMRDYLAAVLPGLADLPIQCLLELTPAAWVAQHS
jgi:hypothetical protein